MAFDYSSPATGNDSLQDIEQIRENFLKLLNCHKGSSAPPIDATHSPGMFWIYTPATGNWVVRQRNKDNTGWIDLWELTTSGVPSGHYALSTATTSVHGARQGSGNGFDADTLDLYHLNDIRRELISPDSYLSRSGTQIWCSADSEVVRTSYLVYVKVKEIYLPRPPENTLKIEFKLANSHSPDWSYARIYRDGSPVGTERSVQGAYATFQEEISGWVNGSYLQLYVKTSDTDTAAHVKDFRILCTKSAIVTLDI